MNCQDFEELLGAYALEALSEDERRAADAHLAICPRCTDTVQQLQMIVDRFPLSVPAIEPPPRLKAQIIAHIQADKASQASLSRQNKTHAERRSRRWSFSLLAATVGLLMLLGGMLAWNLSLRQQVTQLSAQASAPVTYIIHGSGETATATGQMIYYPQQHLTVIILHGLPQLTGTHIYQGWLLQGQQPRSLGLFNTQAGVATLDFPGDVNGYTSVAVSMENGPTASSGTPKGPIVATGSLRKR